MGRVKEAAVGFVLGAVGGCILGATEDPVDQSVVVLTAAGPLKPLVEEVQAVGALGLGSLMGAASLTAAMTSAIAGVILAAVVASMFVSVRSCGPAPSPSAGLWASAGLAAAVGTTLSGATLGRLMEWVVQNYGMLGLLWALSIFTVLKPPLRFLFQLLWKQGTACCTLGNEVWEQDRSRIEEADLQQRLRMAAQVEQKIQMVERGGGGGGGGGGGDGGEEEQQRRRWASERLERESIDRRRMENQEAELEQRSIQDWINTVVIKHVDFMAFSGVPMTVVAIVTSVFGLLGYGGHQAVFIVLLVLVSVISYYLLRSPDFKFWMLVGCMGMICCFVVAMLTLHAGQLVVTAAMKVKDPHQRPSREDVSAGMNLQSAVEALNAAAFGARLCQLGLGATVGGALVRRGAGQMKVTAGAAGMAAALLVSVEVLAPALGDGGTAGALLGVVAAAGVSVGAAAAAAGGWSSWPGTLGNVGGLVLGAAGVGRWHLVNIGLQLPVGYVFAMINPF